MKVNLQSFSCPSGIHIINSLFITWSLMPKWNRSRGIRLWCPLLLVNELSLWEKSTWRFSYCWLFALEYQLSSFWDLLNASNSQHIGFDQSLEEHVKHKILSWQFISWRKWCDCWIIPMSFRESKRVTEALKYRLYHQGYVLTVTSGETTGGWFALWRYMKSAYLCMVFWPLWRFLLCLFYVATAFAWLVSLLNQIYSPTTSHWSN